jgi:hypothetical protein
LVKSFKDLADKNDDELASYYIGYFYNLLFIIFTQQHQQLLLTFVTPSGCPPARRSSSY